MSGDAVCCVLDARGGDEIECVSDIPQLAADVCRRSGYVIGSSGVQIEELASHSLPRASIMLGGMILEEVRRLFAGEVLCVVMDATRVQFFVVKGPLWIAPSILPPAFVSVFK